jgi:small nuclear ribonucleoprotein (snRNP)-like protein
MKVEDYLDQRLLITIKDGREFIGALKCVDKAGNIILAETMENRNSCTDDSNKVKRHIGYCMVPGTEIVSIFSK